MILTANAQREMPLTAGFGIFAMQAPAVILEAAEYFAANGATTPWYANATYPSAFYDSTSQTSWFCWESWNGSARVVQVTTYNHSTGKWSGVFDVATNPLTNDDHGVPAICMDHEGYVHCFYGPHLGDMLHSVTLSPNDPSEWWFQQSFTADDYTYPHPVMVGTTMYLFMRGDAGSPDMPLERRKTSSLSGGVATFGPLQRIILWGGRVYAGAFVVSGTDIHFAAMKANYVDSTRRHVYHFVYDTSDDSIHNADGSTDVVVASQPMDATVADASFRVVDFSTDQGDMPGFCIDSSGNLHIVYARGSSDPYTLYHTIFNGTSWSTPASIGTIDGAAYGNFIDSITLVALSGGVVHLYYPNNKQSFTYGGDMKRRVYNGSWGSETTIREPNTKALSRPSAVRNAHANARVVFCEVNQNSNDSGAGGLKMFAYGDDGYLSRMPQAPTAIALSVDAISEDWPTGATFGRLTVADTDFGDSHTLSIASDPDSKFQLSGDGLQLQAALSYAQATSHNVTIRAKDSYGLTVDQLLNIPVIESNPDMIVLATYSPATVAQQDIPLPAGYRAYKLVGWLRPATDAVNLLLRTSSDGGSTFSAGASDYKYAGSQAKTSGNTAAGSTGTTSVVLSLFADVGNLTQEGIGFEVTIVDPASTSRNTFLMWTGWRVENDAEHDYIMGTGQRMDTAAVDAIRLLFSSGNIAAGELTLLGVPSS